MADLSLRSSLQPGSTKESGMGRVGLVLMVIALVAPGCGLLMADTPAGPPESGVFVGSHGASMRARRGPVANISGKWSGSWRGYDVMGVVPNEDATADLRQQGSRGPGRFVPHPPPLPPLRHIPA